MLNDAATERVVKLLERAGISADNLPEEYTDERKELLRKTVFSAGMDAESYACHESDLIDLLEWALTKKCDECDRLTGKEPWDEGKKLHIGVINRQNPEDSIHIDTDGYMLVASGEGNKTNVALCGRIYNSMPYKFIEVYSELLENDDDRIAFLQTVHNQHTELLKKYVGELQAKEASEPQGIVQ